MSLKFVSRFLEIFVDLCSCNEIAFLVFSFESEALS